MGVGYLFRLTAPVKTTCRGWEVKKVGQRGGEGGRRGEWLFAYLSHSDFDHCFGYDNCILSDILFRQRHHVRCRAGRGVFGGVEGKEPGLSDIRTRAEAGELTAKFVTL